MKSSNRISPLWMNGKQNEILCKCKMMYTEAENPIFTYTEMEPQLSATRKETLRLWSGDREGRAQGKHCTRAGKKTNSVLGITRNVIKNKTSSIVMPLCKSLGIQLHLESPLPFL